MLKHRVIAVLIVRDGRVVQSVKFKHTNVIHYDAYHAIEAFNGWAVDEIVVLNVSKDRKSQADFLEIIKHVSRTCFVPLAAGGWVDTEDYGVELIRNGADKLVINTIAHTKPHLVTSLSRRFGVQCVVGSIDISRQKNGESFIAVNRGEDVLFEQPSEWAKQLVELGVGEILCNSIDYDGNRKGYDLVNLEAISNSVSVPVIAFGGVFMWKHMVEGLEAGADAVAAANIFHYKEHATKQAKRFLASKKFPIREEGQVNYAVL